MKKQIALLFAFVLMLASTACQTTSSQTVSSGSDVNVLSNTDDTSGIPDFSMEEEIDQQVEQIKAAIGDLSDILEIPENGYNYELTAQIEDAIGDLGFLVVNRHKAMPNSERAVQFMDSSEDGYIVFYSAGASYGNVSISGNVLIRDENSYSQKYISLSTENGQWVKNQYEPTPCKNVIVTEHGYLIAYENEETLENGSASLGYRIRPLSEENMTAYWDYVALVDTQADGVLSNSWSESADFRHLPWEFVFERIMETEHGISMQNADGPYYIADDEVDGYSIVPADVFEGTLQQYFNVSTETLREARTLYADRELLYNSADNTYKILGFRGGGYSPITEVWDVANNPDGSISISVAYVSPDFGESAYIYSVLTVMPQADGGYKYISNIHSEESIKNTVDNALDLAVSASNIYIGEFITAGENVQQNGYNYAAIDYENGDFWEKNNLGGLMDTESVQRWFEIIFAEDAAKKYLGDIFATPLYIDGGTEENSYLLVNLDKKNLPIAAGTWSTDSFELIENTPDTITVRLAFETAEATEKRLLTFLRSDDRRGWLLTDSYEGHIE